MDRWWVLLREVGNFWYYCFFVDCGLNNCCLNFGVVIKRLVMMVFTNHHLLMRCDDDIFWFSLWPTSPLAGLWSTWQIGDVTRRRIRRIAPPRRLLPSLCISDSCSIILPRFNQNNDTWEMFDTSSFYYQTASLLGPTWFCSPISRTQPQMHVSSVIFRVSSALPLCSMAFRMSQWHLHTRRAPLLFHQRKQFSLWSLASIVKNKGASRFPLPAVNFDTTCLLLWCLVPICMCNILCSMKNTALIRSRTQRCHYYPRSSLLQMYLVT